MVIKVLLELETIQNLPSSDEDRLVDIREHLVNRLMSLDPKRKTDSLGLFFKRVKILPPFKIEIKETEEINERIPTRYDDNGNVVFENVLVKQI